MRSRKALALAALLTISACAPAVVTPPSPGVPGVTGREPNVRVGVAVDTATVEISSSTALTLVDGTTNRTLQTIPAGATVVVSAEGSNRLRARANGADVYTVVSSSSPDRSRTAR
jgi:hypothetical protein